MGNISMDGSNFLAKKMFGELWITPSMWSNSSCWIATGLQAHQSIVLRQWMVMEAYGRTGSSYPMRSKTNQITGLVQLRYPKCFTDRLTVSIDCVYVLQL